MTRLAARAVALTALTVVVASCGETIVEPPPPPERPLGLTATLQPPKSVRLTWSAVSAGDGTITYIVYRNDAKLAEVSTTEYADSTVVSNTAYTWYVVARTEKGGTSAPSDPVTLAFGDIAPPAVISTTPTNGASDASRLPTPTVVFSEPIIPASVTEGAITAKITGTGETVYGTINYDSASRTADFWPLSILPARTSVTITVTTGVRDVAGNPLTTPFSFSFTTGDTPASNADLPAHVEQLLVSAASFFSNEGRGPRDLFKMKVDGTGRVNITNNVATDLGGSWSPDGRHVVFSSDRNGSHDIFLMRDDGRGVRRLTNDASSESQPRWSPDAKRIFFLSTKEGTPPAPGYNTPSDIWSMNPDGTGQVNVSKSPTVYEYWPHPSPDGQKLLFSRQEYNGSPQIWVSDASGANPRSLGLVHPGYVDDYASWSPDGRQIAISARDFTVYITATDLYAILLADADGSNVRVILPHGSYAFPAWSPDASALLFSYSSNEFFGRFGLIGAATFTLATSTFTSIAPLESQSQVMSPQSWRR